MKENRLSLVAQFDDIVRNTTVLTTGIETEFWRFAQAQEENRLQWLEALNEAKEARRKLKASEQENATLQTKLKHARSQIDIEMKKRSKAEADRDTLERQILLVRELLMDRNNQTMLNERDRERLAFLSTDFPSHVASPRGRKDAGLSVIEESMSLLSDDDISYDKTGDDLETSALRSGRKYKRPSAPPMEDEEDMTPPDKKSRADRSQERRQRKHRRSKSATTVTTTTVTMEKGNSGFDARAEISTSNKSPKHRRTRSGGKMKKHHSAKDIKELNKENQDSDDSYQRTPQSILGQYNHTPESPRLRSYSSAGKGLNRPHIFVSKTVIRPETCIPCGKRIRFGKEAMKCKDCRATSHRECKDQVPLPCIPSTVTPGTAKSAPGVLADYAPNDPPMIPALVIHCVNEVEARGLSEAGLYRVPGAEREVKELKEKFLRGKGTPNLTHVDDIHVVCGCLKDFLRNLKEPIITYNLWDNFYKAAIVEDEEESVSNLYQAISRLPQANRDTLAFMILHLQRVSESVECKMGVNNLSKVFGPTLIGYSTPEPEPMQIMSETGKQAKVMERLMLITADYWTNFITIDTEEMIPLESMTPQTPEARPVPHSMLGPVITPGNEERKGWFTPRFGSKSRQISKKPNHFFNSPSIK